MSLLPAKLTGADLYSVCSHAWLIALRTLINKLTHGKYSDRVINLLKVYYFPIFILEILQFYIIRLKHELDLNDT